MIRPARLSLEREPLMNTDGRRYQTGSKLGLALFLLCWLGTGCARTETEEAATPNPLPAPAEQAPPPPSAAPALASVNESLEKGSFDDAAARLLELRAAGRQFTERDATAYRKALNQAYEQAMEAAARGDKRAEAAIQMIRAQGQ